MEGMYKIVDLFGNEQVCFANKKRRKNSLFDDYEGFVEKFQRKKTTDDCYTPEEVMKIVIDYVNEKYPLKDKQIIRPFYPGGDYESIDYPENAVVIDNPPFSIISQICRFYVENNIKFFLFCPHLTAFGIRQDVTFIIASAGIRYENGAVVPTSFVSNLFGDAKIIGDAELCKKFKELEEKNKANLPKYEYPPNVITVSKISYFVERGVSLKIDKKDLWFLRGLESQKKFKKAIFGGGFLASKKAAEMVQRATEEAAKQRATEERKNVYFWELSEKEKEIINRLG